MADSVDVLINSEVRGVYYHLVKVISCPAKTAYLEPYHLLAFITFQWVRGSGVWWLKNTIITTKYCTQT